jgi:hypothetical protein
VLSDLRIAVQDQLVDGVRVASRYVVSGTFRGRQVSFDGITISRIENDLIVEDWSVTDTFGNVAAAGPVASAADAGPSVADCHGYRATRRFHDQ